jgi:hypothetical protein
MTRSARLEYVRHFLHSLDYPGKDAGLVHVPGPLIVGCAQVVVLHSDRIRGVYPHPHTRTRRAKTCGGT